MKVISRSQSHFHRYCSSSHHDSYRGHAPSHDIEIIAATLGVAGDAHILGITAINPTVTGIDPAVIHPTNLITDCLHIGVPQLTISRDHSRSHVHIHPTNPQDKIQKGYTHSPADDMRQTTSQEEPESEDRRSTHGLLQF